LVAEYEASGMTRKAFCAGRGLSEATLDLYRALTGETTLRFNPTLEKRR
jgi:hypothetical protein